MTASMTVIKGLGGGGGAGESVVWMSPAKAVLESTHTSVIANTKRLISSFSHRFQDARLLVQKQNTANARFLAWLPGYRQEPAVIRTGLLHSLQRVISCEESLTKTAKRTPYGLTKKPCLGSDRTGLKDKVDNADAREVMRRLWRGVGERLEVKGLHASVAAEVQSCVGILTGWMGSKNQIEEAQEAAKICLQRELLIMSQ